MDFDVVIHYFKALSLSGKRDSNSRPRPWQGRALPTELFPHLLLSRFQPTLASFYSSKAAAKVQTFFHSTKLFSKKSCNPLISKPYFLFTPPHIPLQNHPLHPLSPQFSTLSSPPPCSYLPNSLISHSSTVFSALFTIITENSYSSHSGNATRHMVKTSVLGVMNAAATSISTTATLR